MKRLKIFVDSDVVISSLLSNTGAAYFLLNEFSLNLFISNISVIELDRGVKKLNLNRDRLTGLIKNRLRVVKLRRTITNIKKDEEEYVFDENDAHIVAGAKKAKAKLILSYNIKDFNLSKLKQNFNLIVITPAKLLQYLRSLS